MGNIYGDLTVKSFYDIFGSTYHNWDKLLCNNMLNKYKIDTSKKMSSLSVGQTAQVFFIFTISQKARVLLLDEATSGLDPFVREEINSDLKQYVENNDVGVIYSSHIISDIERVATRIILIKDGKLLLDESLDKLKSNYFIVDKVFLEEMKFTYKPIVKNEDKQYVVYVDDDLIQQNNLEKYRKSLEDTIFNLYGEKYDETI